MGQGIQYGPTISAIQMTGTACVGAASAVPATLVAQIVSDSQARLGKSESAAVIIRNRPRWSLAKPEGRWEVNGEVKVSEQEIKVKIGSVYRTARRLKEGTVCWLGA